jgi:Ran GTPase-activating protein (RanGAP) involved in mRNA processing and transport
LKTLVLRDGAIGGDAMDEIVEGLVANTTLEAFGIVNDLLFPDSITKLFEGLSRNPRITQLKLEDCLPNKFFSRQDMVDLIANNTTITHLDLSRNWRIGLGGIDGLRHIIENNKTLKFINLAACDLTVEQLQGIVQALENNTTLTGLQLDRDIDPAIAAEITRLLERNRNE